MRVDCQFLQNIGVSIGLVAYHGNGNQREGREYPNLTVSIKAGGTGYFAYLFPGDAEPEAVTAMVSDLERAFDSFGIDYRATGLVVIGGMSAHEYEIEA